MGLRLQATTWLAPGLPMQLFTVACDAIAVGLDAEVSLRSDVRSSGPPAGEPDPFATGDCDLGFLCLPSYQRLAAIDPPSIRLVAAAPVPSDPRCEGRPVYFAELLVRTGRGHASLRDLAGAVVAGNDAESLSGSVALIEALGRLDPPIAVEQRLTGSHHASMAALAAGEVDAAVVDSNTRLAAGLPDGCEVAEAWGPYPVQPIVLAARLDRGIGDRVAAALLAVAPEQLDGTGFVGFAKPVVS